MAATPLLLPEWAPQSGIMLTWPHTHSDWRVQLDEIEPVYCELVRVISAYEPALITVYDRSHLTHVQRRLHDTGVNLEKCVFVTEPTNDTWVRDYGPISVLERGHPRLVDFGFNGWGGKFTADLDDSLSRRLHARQIFGEIPFETADVVLEGGSIDTDGAGTLITTHSCLLNPTRNPQPEKRLLELKLKRFVGATRVVWLQNSYLAGDDTDGHVDMLARFCGPRTLAYITSDQPDDEHYDSLMGLKEELELAFPASAGYTLIALPLPRAIYDTDGHRLPASYANFLIINGAVLVPCYGDPADQTAMRRLKRAFPNHQLEGIDCTPLIRQHGSLHCATMQLPRGVLTRANAPHDELSAI